jgi:rhodanese-related sulfurtransferase
MKQIQPIELQACLASTAPPLLVDVREREEWDHCRLPDALFRPLSEIALWESELASHPGEIVIYCHHGVRSARVCARLMALGHPSPTNLAGGIDRWSQTVDAEVPRY